MYSQSEKHLLINTVFKRRSKTTTQIRCEWEWGEEVHHSLRAICDSEMTKLWFSNPQPARLYFNRHAAT